MRRLRNARVQPASGTVIRRKPTSALSFAVVVYDVLVRMVLTTV
jgi:hypothetical protein